MDLGTATSAEIAEARRLVRAYVGTLTPEERALRRDLLRSTDILDLRLTTGTRRMQSSAAV